jgi:hypothetical protein
VRPLTDEELLETRRWRDRYDAEDTLAGRAAVLTEAAVDLGVTPRTLHDRWCRLGMSRAAGRVQSRIQDAIRAEPFATDAELAVRISKEVGGEVSPKSIQRARSALGFVSGSERRRWWISKEVRWYRDNFPELSAATILEAIQAENPPFPVSLFAVASVLRELRQ